MSTFNGFCCSFLHPYSPVVAVDIVQPAALLHHLHGARDVLPRGEAMPPLVFLSGGAGFNPAAVGAILLPAGVVVSALLCLGAPQNGTWTGGTHFNQGLPCKKQTFYSAYWNLKSFFIFELINQDWINNLCRTLRQQRFVIQFFSLSATLKIPAEKNRKISNRIEHPVKSSSVWWKQAAALRTSQHLSGSPSVVDRWQAWTVASWLVQEHSRWGKPAPSVWITLCLTKIKLSTSSGCWLPIKKVCNVTLTAAAAPNMSVLCTPPPGQKCIPVVPTGENRFTMRCSGLSTLV